MWSVASNPLFESGSLLGSANLESMTILQIIGGGRMGQALLSGLIAAEWAAPDQLTVVEVERSQHETLASNFPGVHLEHAPLSGVDAVLAVKPYLAAQVCEFIQRPQRVISIAAGITVATLEAALDANARVIRVMPNTPALVGAGASGVAAGTRASQADVEWALGILGAVGLALEVDEPLIDSVTGLSGSGPAYVFALADAMAQAGVNAGLSLGAATQLANQTILGAGRMLTETGQSAKELREMVTTPGGTTEAGLRALTKGNFEQLINSAVAAATKRSRQLGTE